MAARWRHTPGGKPACAKSLVTSSGTSPRSADPSRTWTWTRSPGEPEEDEEPEPLAQSAERRPGRQTARRRTTAPDRGPTSSSRHGRQRTPGGRRSARRSRARSAPSSRTHPPSTTATASTTSSTSAFAVLLGWSPVTRAASSSRKRKSEPARDENEDGGRAVVIEEGIAALVFGYAGQHRMLEGVTRLDQKLLDTIEMMAASTEAGLRTQADWERAILASSANLRPPTPRGRRRNSHLRRRSANHDIQSRVDPAA